MDVLIAGFGWSFHGLYLTGSLTSTYVFCVLFAFTALEFPQEQRKPRDIGKGTIFDQIAKTSIDFFSTLIFSCVYHTFRNRYELYGAHNAYPDATTWA